MTKLVERGECGEHRAGAPPSVRGSQEGWRWVGAVITVLTKRWRAMRPTLVFRPGCGQSDLHFTDHSRGEWPEEAC